MPMNDVGGVVDGQLVRPDGRAGRVPGLSGDEFSAADGDLHQAFGSVRQSGELLDSVQKVGKTRIMLSMKASDGGTYKAVMNIKSNPHIVTFYKTKKP